MCETCRQARAQEKHRARYLANKEQHKARARAWDAANPERVKQRSAAWRANNPDKVEAKNCREKGIVFANGDSKSSLIAQQKCLCAVCRRDLTGLPTKKVCIDHDHAITDGRPNVRGILCDRCNFLLGKAQDSVAVLQAAIEYLNSNNLHKTV